MSGYISRQVAIRAIKDHINFVNTDMEGYNMARLHIMELIEVLPSADVVEVVRCKDCKHMHESLLNGSPFETFCDVFPAYIHKDDYCSYGERAGISLIDTRKEGAK